MTADDLAALHVLAFPSHPRPWSAAEFGALIESPGVFLTGNGTAFAVGRAIAGEAELLTIAVHPDARRRGLGRAQLAAFEAEARARAADEAFLEVAADNAAARALYTAAGYVPAGLRPGYYLTGEGTRVDALILKKALAGPPTS